MLALAGREAVRIRGGPAEGVLALGAPALRASPVAAPLRPIRPAPRLVVFNKSAGAGGNVLDRPATAPGIDKKNETRRKKPPSYRVLLHNDDFNKREYVVQVLLKVAGIGVEDALNIMQEAHINGLALVTVCSQDKAETMCESMRNSGLISTIEPDGPAGA